ncbi:MAG: MFS transporter [Proteobacteria bacterium]|nr:MFS transporter [Pseudomonadota bacterium]
MERENLRNITLLLASTMTVMAGTTISPALPAMRAFFRDVPQVDLQIKLVLTLPALAIACGALFTGYLLDRYGRKPVLIFGLLLYGIAGSSGFLLNDLIHLLASRALLGVAVSALMTACTTLLADYYTGAVRNRLMGLQNSFMAFGGVIFLIMGGFLADFGWRYPFLVYSAAFPILIGALISIHEPKLRGDQSTTDGPEGNTASFPKMQIWSLYLLGFGSMVAFYIYPVQIPFYLQSLGELSNARVGLIMAALNLVGAMVSMNYQRIKAKFSHLAVFAISFGFWGIGYWIIGDSRVHIQVLIGLLVTGIGTGLLFPNLMVLMVTISPEKYRGRIVGGLTMSIFLGQFLSPVILAPIIGKYHSSGSFKLIGLAFFAFAALFATVSFKKAERFRPQ